MPWTSLSSIKVHRIRVPVGCSFGAGRRGLSRPTWGACKSRGLFVQCPVCLPPPKKKTTLGARSQHLLFSLPRLRLRQGKTHFFYIFRGRRSMRRARFSPVGRGRGESRDAMARLGLGSADTCCCSWRFIVAQTALLVSGLGLRPTAPCPEGCEDGGGA